MTRHHNESTRLLSQLSVTLKSIINQIERYNETLPLIFMHPLSLTWLKQQELFQLAQTIKCSVFRSFCLFLVPPTHHYHHYFYDTNERIRIRQICKYSILYLRTALLTCINYRATPIFDANGTGLNISNVPNSVKQRIDWQRRMKNDDAWVYHRSEKRKTTMSNWNRSRCVTTGSTLTPILARYKLYKVVRQARLHGNLDFIVKLVILSSRIVPITSITSMEESVSSRGWEYHSWWRMIDSSCILL